MCTDEFFALAKAEANGWGLPGLPILAVPHPLAKRTDEECGEFAADLIGEVVDALTQDARRLETVHRQRLVPPGQRRYHSLFESDFNAPDGPDIASMPDSLTAFERVAHQRGWTDGLPVIPPTSERVDAMLGDRSAQSLIAIVEPRLGRATAHKLAANAVMAGCDPAHFPLVMAATRAMCDPVFNLKSLQSTTHPCTVMVLVAGPIVTSLGINASYNAMGQGVLANAAIGRAIRLILMNIGGASPGVLDRSTMGSPAKFSFCFAENLAASPWASWHVDNGMDADTDFVTVCGVEGPHNVNDHYGRTGREILLTIAGTLASPGANNFYLEGEPVVVLGPEHAEVIARDGFSRADVCAFLSEHAIVPAALVSPAMMEVMTERMPHHVLGGNRDGSGSDIRFITEPDDLMVLVAGGAGRHSAVIPTFGHATRAVTVPIE